MKTSLRTLLKVASVTGLMISLGACSEPTQVQDEGTIASFDANRFAINKLVCNPMGGDVASADNGLQATLYYLEEGQPHYNKVMDYINNGVRSEQYLFYSDVNIPTRIFDTGFPSMLGGMVVNDSGDNLIEYFGLQFRSNMRLDSADEEGEYQLAILSDDGAILNDISNDDSPVTLVDNDGDHMTKFGCGVKTVTMTHAKSIPIQLNYYQGPRYHIAVTLMWRKVSAADAAKDVSCGVNGNDTFFDSSNSTPKQAYNDLLARGWKPLKQTNFSIKETSGYNPCVQGLVPVISNIALEEVGPGSIRVSWVTDIPATSQVRVVAVSGESELLTTSDNILRQRHSIVVNNVPLGENLMAQGVSISETLGKALSAGINFRLE